MFSKTMDFKAAGYSFLIDEFNLKVIPHWHSSQIGQTGALTTKIDDGRVTSIYPPSYWPGDAVSDHLEFALKYDGINPGILAALFKVIDPTIIVSWVNNRPTGKNARRVWFLYEFITGRKLPLDDVKTGNYVELLDPDSYYTISPGRRSRRHRIIDNQLGVPAFSPIIRRTDRLQETKGSDLQGRLTQIATRYSADLLRRALRYLYSRETKSTFQIEHVRPDSTKTEKFIALLQHAGVQDFVTGSSLQAVQNAIVDERFKATGYRTTQNYVGQTIMPGHELVHYVPPKPDNLPRLMSGLIDAHDAMKQGLVPAVIHAAAISYGFVFLHPFEDGNGRIHRFLIHNILSIRAAIPKGLIFPVSASMLKHRELYDKSLEAFSAPLMQAVDYELDDLGQMTVKSDTEPMYQYIDMTAQAEALYDFIWKTVDHELVEELDFLASYDETRQAISQIADIPDRLIDLFIRLCLQNKGKLSSAKRKSHFASLSDDEIARMEAAVRANYCKAGA